jgi:hypothetical protein
MGKEQPHRQESTSPSTKTKPAVDRAARWIRQRSAAIGTFLDKHEGWVGFAVLVFIVLIAFLVAFGIDPRVSGQGAELKDFFNDVVALCVVVMFAKFLSHGRGASRTGHPVWAFLHGLCLVFAALGVFAALRGAEGGDPGWLYGLAWVGAVVSTVILGADVFLAGFRA